MNPGFRTYDSQGRETFNIFMPVIKQQLFRYLPANSSGTIDLTGYLNGSSAVRFIPATFHSYGNPIMPFANMQGNVLHWRTSSACYAIVTGVVR